MKKLLILFAFIAISLSGFSQKYAFVDMEYIFNNIPSYKSTQEQLDKFAKKLQDEVDAEKTEVEAMFKKYQAERVLLSESMKQKREEEIITREEELNKLRNQYFGQEGVLYKKREELVKPFQDEVYNAMQEMANEGGYALVFDVSSDASIVFYNSKYDKSDAVLKKMGYGN